MAKKKTMIVTSDITGIILAGGEGRRMGGQDKGWVNFNNQPLIIHSLSRLLPQVASVIISANRELTRYQSLHHKVISDKNMTHNQESEHKFQGPLAGIISALEEIQTPYAFIIPVDAPLISPKLVETLLTHHEDKKLTLFDDGKYLQPLFGLYHRTLLDSLNKYYAQGHRRLLTWCLEQSPTIVQAPELSLSFNNINDLTTLQSIEAFTTTK